MIDGRIPTFLAATAMLLLVGWVLWLGPTRRLHRALALLVLLRALVLLVLSFDDRALSPAGRFTAYLLIAIPFAALHFAYLFQREYGPSALKTPWTSRSVRTGILLAALVFEGIYLVRHDVWGRFDPQVAFLPGPFFLFATLSYLTYAASAYVIARAAGRSQGVRSQALAIVAIGFAVEPAFRAAFHLAAEPSGRSLSLGGLEYGIWAATMVFCVLTLWRLARNRVSGSILQGPILWLGGGILAGLGMRLLFAGIPTLLSLDTALAVLWSFDAIAFGIFAAFLSYATIMYHLFDAELKAKAVLRGGSLAAVLGFIIIVVGESIERVLPVSNTVLAIFVAVAITLTLRPAQRLAQRLCEAAFPGVERSDRYLGRRREQVYRAALEGAYRDGAITPKERQVLMILRDQIGLGPEAARRLEDLVRSGDASSRSPGDRSLGLPSDEHGLPKPP